MHLLYMGIEMFYPYSIRIRIKTFLALHTGKERREFYPYSIRIRIKTAGTFAALVKSTGSIRIPLE